MNEEIYEREVIGEHNSFQVYLYLLQVRRSSARDVQKALGFSSPALATHHLEKLVTLELAKKDDYGSYIAIPKSFGILKSYIVVGTHIIPRMIFVVVLFAVMMLGFFVSLPRNHHLIWALLPSVIGFVISTYQTSQRYLFLRKRLCKK